MIPDAACAVRRLNESSSSGAGVLLAYVLSKDAPSAELKEPSAEVLASYVLLKEPESPAASWLEGFCAAAFPGVNV